MCFFYKPNDYYTLNLHFCKKNSPVISGFFHQNRHDWGHRKGKTPIFVQIRVVLASETTAKRINPLSIKKSVRQGLSEKYNPAGKALPPVLLGR